MNLKSQISKRVSRSALIEIAVEIASSQKSFNTCWKLVKTESHPTSYQASWIMCEAVALNPKLLNKKLIVEVIDQFKIENTDGIKRHMGKMLTFKKFFPEDLEAIIFDMTLLWIINPKELVALKVHGMQNAFHICKRHPELKEELVFVIQEVYEKNSVAFKARAKQILKQLNRLS